MSRLDQWLPAPTIRSHHRGAAAVGPDALWAAARAVRLDDTATLGRLVRWRIPGTPADITFHELFRRYPFVVLEEGERHLVAGLAGRIWTLARDYPDLGGPEAFRAWDERGTTRVAFCHWVEEASDGAVLHTEARVEPVDRLGAVRLRALWTVVGRFERLIGAQGLRAAINRTHGV